MHSLLSEVCFSLEISLKCSYRGEKKLINIHMLTLDPNLNMGFITNQLTFKMVKGFDKGQTFQFTCIVLLFTGLGLLTVVCEDQFF